MSNQEILERAIKKARVNGWKSAYKVTYTVKSTQGDKPLVSTAFPDAESFIYNHDFAKALWGESLIHDVIARNYSRDTPMYASYLFIPPNNWEFHLQQMVIAEDPIKYLGENID